MHWAAIGPATDRAAKWASVGGYKGSEHILGRGHRIEQPPEPELVFLLRLGLRPLAVLANFLRNPCCINSL